ncbi:MAG: hypothetical protein JRG91_11830, partial [Deltaproteobacteria bacterium]|nr:hypothetical protein [Deltaproteobacteria bacterium]
MNSTRITGLAGLAAGAALMAYVLSSVRDGGLILTWHWAAYPVGIVLACLGFWSLWTARLPWNPPPRRTRKLDDLHPRFFFVETWRDINREAFGVEADAKKGKRKRGRGSPAGAAALVDRKVIVVFLIAAFTLTLQEYFGDRLTLIRFWPEALHGHYGELNGFAYWSLWRFFGYAVIPGIAVLLTPGMRLRDCGVSFKGFFDHLWIYGILFVIVLLMVAFVSFKPDFQSYYPFYAHTHRSWFDFFAWEGLYALQFVSLEFFFRGFMLHPLKRSLGAYSILFMMVPYCMIHYGKPYLEANAAIVAGLVL